MSFPYESTGQKVLGRVHLFGQIWCMYQDLQYALRTSRGIANRCLPEAGKLKLHVGYDLIYLTAG